MAVRKLVGRSANLGALKHSALAMATASDAHESGELCRWLVEQDVDLNGSYDLGKGQTTALILAIQARQPELAKLYLAKGALPDLRDGAGQTPLMVAGTQPCLESVRALLEAGADPALTDAAGRSALDLARASALCGEATQLLFDAAHKNAFPAPPIALRSGIKTYAQLPAAAAEELPAAAAAAYRELHGLVNPSGGYIAPSALKEPIQSVIKVLADDVCGALLIWLLRESFVTRIYRRNDPFGPWNHVQTAAIHGLLRRSIALDLSATLLLLYLAAEVATRPMLKVSAKPFCDTLLTALERHRAALREGLPLHHGLVRFASCIGEKFGEDTPANTRELQRRVTQLVTETQNRAVTLWFPPASDAWSAALAADLAALEPPQREAWSALLQHASSATGSEPSAKWLKLSGPLVSALGQEELARGFMHWLSAVHPPKSGTAAPLPISEGHQHLLKALSWSWLHVNPSDRVEPMERLANLAYTKIRGHGAVAPSAGHAALVVLERTPDAQATTCLLGLYARVRYDVAKTRIAKALDVHAKHAGISRAELIDISTVDVGLDGAGERVTAVADHQVILRALPSGARLVWRTPAGVERDTCPSALARREPAATRKLKDDFAKLQRGALDLARRLEGTFTSDRSWTWQEFSTRFLARSTARFVVQRLIWQLAPAGKGAKPQVVFWNGAAWVTSSGERVQPAATTQVTLWHPVDASAADIALLRERIEQQGMLQPFKQAHREVYPVTPAEIETQHISARFAGHSLRQSVFAELARQRHWSYRLQGTHDSSNEPSLFLPQQNIEVSWELDPIEHAGVSSVGYTYLRSGRLFFTRDGQPLATGAIEPRIFSEVMRDVDLFVAVASAAVDAPEPLAAATFGDYWETQSFGPLSPSASTRHDLLSRLVPRLAIASRCTLKERFLEVRGDLRTYLIHLGSGNILMEPGRQYLCIVPRSDGSVSGVALPFEGDRILSIILSKALMLARDRDIEDAGIVAQLQGT